MFGLTRGIRSMTYLIFSERWIAFSTSSGTNCRRAPPRRLVVILAVVASDRGR